MAKPRVLIQMGHVAPRQPGHLDQTGTNGEIDLVSAIGKKLDALLTKDGRFDNLLIPGLMPTPDWKGDVFLALHADGAAPSAHGYSLGWHPDELGPKTTTMRKLLVQEYEKLDGHPLHHTDNYTVDMREYYGYYHCKADVKILIEHGFMTNATERLWLTNHTGQIASAWYLALLQYFRLPVTSTTTTDKSKLTDREAFNLHRQWAFGEDDYKQYGPFEGPRPKELDTPDWNPAPTEWFVKEIKQLKRREQEV